MLVHMEHRHVCVALVVYVIQFDRRHSLESKFKMNVHLPTHGPIHAASRKHFHQPLQRNTERMQLDVLL